MQIPASMTVGNPVQKARTFPPITVNDSELSKGIFLAMQSIMADRKTVPEMLGEFFREAGVLAAVFIPLDLVMIDRPLTPALGIFILGISGGLLVAGMVLERKRKP